MAYNMADDQYILENFLFRIPFHHPDGRTMIVRTSYGTNKIRFITILFRMYSSLNIYSILKRFTVNQ